MNNYPRKCLVHLGCFLLLGCILIGFLSPSPVQAGALKPILPGGSSIKPGEETVIQMASQVVTINIRQAVEADNALVKLTPDRYTFQHNPIWFPAFADVEADFTMKNPTSEAVSMTVWFPLASALENTDWKLYKDETVPSIANFQVSVNGSSLDYTVSELPNPKGADKPPLPWAGFQGTFPGGSDTVIHVSYSLPPQPFGEIEMALYYIFQTGAGWAGPIGRVELILNLPYPASAETVAGMPFDSLVLPPYYWPSARADLPPATTSMKENRVQIWWHDFEPGPGDDFAVWLLRPHTWHELEAARLAVEANPQDGQAWLDLGSTYYFRLESEFITLPIFSSSFIPAGIAAYRKAADLLPNHPAPHAGLGLLSLLPYTQYKNAPSDVIRYVQEELQIALKLDARNPSLMKESGISRYLLMRSKNALDSYLYNDATQAVESTAQSAASQTANAIMLQTTSATPTLEFTLTGTPTLEPTLAATPLPSDTPQPVQSLTPSVPPLKPTEAQSENETLSRTGLVIILGVAGFLVLVVVIYLVLKRLRKSTG